MVEGEERDKVKVRRTKGKVAVEGGGKDVEKGKRLW